MRRMSGQLDTTTESVASRRRLSLPDNNNINRLVSLLPLSDTRMMYQLYHRAIIDTAVVHITIMKIIVLSVGYLFTETSTKKKLITNYCMYEQVSVQQQQTAAQYCSVLIPPEKSM